MRSTPSQEHLESCLLMAREKDILLNLDLDGVIDRVAKRSESLSQLLIPEAKGKALTKFLNSETEFGPVFSHSPSLPPFHDRTTTITSHHIPHKFESTG